MMAGAIFVIFVVSGFAGLAYELVWTRHLMLIFGVSSHAISTVLAAFMAGLAVGSVVLGRAADRVRHPLRLYALLEVGIGASALALPAALGLVNDAYVATARALPAHSWLLGAARFLLCFGILLVPTTLMGGTLPAMSRELIRRADVVGRGAGLLYGANTVGGVLGAGASGYLLLRTLGSHKTTLLAVGLNFAVAAAAGALSLRARALRPALRAEAPEPAPVSPEPRRWLPTVVLVAFGLAGAASLAYEVLWTRVLVYFMDLTIYSFTTILVTFLTGIALGSFLFARAADRGRNLLALFAAMELLIAVSAVYLVQTMGTLLSASRAMGALLLPGAAGSEMIARFAAAFILILGPAILMGGVFPVVTRLYTRDLRGLGRSLGEVYAANTIGCVLGSLAAGFVLLRVLDAQQSIAVVAAVNGALGVTLLLVAAGHVRAQSSGASVPPGGDGGLAGGAARRVRQSGAEPERRLDRVLGVRGHTGAQDAGAPRGISGAGAADGAGDRVWAGVNGVVVCAASVGADRLCGAGGRGAGEREVFPAGERRCGG
jgi:spermidine synthase